MPRPGADRPQPTGAARCGVPQCGCGKPGCRQGRGAGHTDTEWSRKDGIGPAGEGHRVRVSSLQAGSRQDRAQGFVRHGRYLPSSMAACRDYARFSGSGKRLAGADLRQSGEGRKVRGFAPETPPRGAAPWIPAKGGALGTLQLERLDGRGPCDAASVADRRSPVRHGSSVTWPPPVQPLQWMDCKGCCLCWGFRGQSPLAGPGQSPGLTSRQRRAARAPPVHETPA